jgi:hypothetical protein
MGHGFHGYVKYPEGVYIYIIRVPGWTRAFEAEIQVIKRPLLSL